MRSTGTLRVKIFLPGLLMAIVLFVAGCSSATDSGEPTPSTSTSEQALPSAEAENSCEPAVSTPRNPDQVGMPTSLLEPKEYTLTLITNCGEIIIAADAKKAPKTVSTMGFLANAKYFDGTLCHRLTTSGIFVLQCGDPSASGSAGPGFSIEDENLPQPFESNYPKGTVAMANSGPNTNGSQFFLVYADTTLGPNYTIWGKIIRGMDVLEKIAGTGTSSGVPDGSPKFPIEIRRAILSK